MFTFPIAVIWLHMGWVLLAYFGLTAIGVLLTRRFRGRLASAGFGALTMFVFSAFALLYLLNIIALSNWGQNMTLRILRIFSTDVPALLDALPFDARPGIAGLCLAILFILWGFWKCSAPLYKAVAEFGDRLLRTRRQIMLTGTVLFLCCSLLALFIIPQIGYVKAYYKFHGEPVYNFLRSATPTFEASSIDLQKEQTIKKDRQNYPRDLTFDRKNVILIIVDALRDDHMGVYGYQRENTPFLSKLRKENKLQLVHQVSSGCSTSFCGILSVLSSATIPNLGCTNYKIQDVFKDLGYQSNFLLSGSHNEWYNLRRYYENYHQMDFYKDGSDSPDYGLSDDRFIFNYMDEIPAFDGQPAFFYIHLKSTHMSGTKLEEYALYKPAGKTSYLQPDSSVIVNGYDNGVYQADQYIKRLFAQLEEKNYLKNAIVAITSDHGEALGLDARYGHSGDVYQDKLRIPLLFYEASEPANDDLFFASHVDIAPTILAKLGLPKPATWDGMSLENSDSIRYSYHRQGNHFAVLKKNGTQVFKLIHESSSGKDELYLLHEDPKERMNVAADPSFKALLEELKARYVAAFVTGE